MIRTSCPKRLWDDCLELEALIQSSTASNIYGTEGEALDMIVSGETTDISQFCKHAWYDWVYFRDTVASFPDDAMVLGRYLGPSVDIGPAMTAKILKANGQVVHHTTYRGITPEEQASPTKKAKREEHNRMIREALGPTIKADDLPGEDAETLTYDLYEDDGGEVHRHICDEPTPEEGDNFINAEVLLPRGSEMLSGTMRRRKRDADGNLQGTQNDNPILDTRTYEVEFPDGQVAEYTTNVIAANIWAQSDLSGDQYLLLQDIVDYRKNGHAVSNDDCWIYVNGRKYPKKST